MLIRKLVIAGLVLAAVGVMITVTTRGVIGQQPGTAENSGGVVEEVPATKGPVGTLDPVTGAGDSELPASDDSRTVVKDGVGGRTSSADQQGEVAAPPANSDSASGTTPGKTKGRGKSSGKTPRSDSAGPGMRPAMGMPGTGMSSGMMQRNDSGMYGFPQGMGMSGAGMMGQMSGMGMTVPVPEDLQLETWVSQALADYARTEDQNARQKQRAGIAQALDRIFDIRQERRMQELGTLEQRVQKLRGTLETREKLKSDILKNRLDYLVREADGLGWGDGLPAQGRSASSGFGSSSSGFPNLPAVGGIDSGDELPPGSGAASRVDPFQ